MNKLAIHPLVEHARITPESVRPNFCMAVRPNEYEDFIPVYHSDEPLYEPGSREWQYAIITKSKWLCRKFSVIRRFRTPARP